MSRARTIPCVASLVGALLAPAVARADVTAFWGAGTTPVTRASRGLAFGVSLVVVGFEVEYGNTVENADESAPSLRTGTINGLIQTPTKTQLYVTVGGGFYHEGLGTEGVTGFGTNLGGGIKLPLAGPLRLRVDYRVFSLHGSPRFRSSQRIYGAMNFNF